MKQTAICIRIDQIRIPVKHTTGEVLKKAEKILGIKERDCRKANLVRRSLDARKKPDVFYVYTVDLWISPKTRYRKSAHVRVITPVIYDPLIRSGEKEDAIRRTALTAEQESPRIAVIGCGPAGLFAAYLLALNGLRPLLIERGKPAGQRQKDVERFWETGRLDPASNVQFGEGGAGTFSDGKLNTRVNDRSGRNRFVLETFVRFGAPEEILYDAAPHLGTDRLVKIVTAMREEIVRLGGTVLFETTLTDLHIRDGQICGLVTDRQDTIPADACILAVGHSARDTFRMLYGKQIPMQAKPFAAGFRIEHPQTMINGEQYGHNHDPLLPPAAYKLTHRSKNGRSVYTFCMCPGGYVVNAASGPSQTVVNGMSYSGRGSQNANSAVVVSVNREDFENPDHPLSGMVFQEKLEERAWRAGNGSIPQQTFGAFEAELDSDVPCEDPSGSASEPSQNQCNLPAESRDPAADTPEIASCTKGRAVSVSLKGILPEAVGQALTDGIHAFGRKIHGFDRPDAILSAVESRTSSPVRILRNEDCESEVRGLYPCGEGAGYAGGIVSSALDGINCADRC